MNGLVIAMPDFTTGMDNRIADHPLPFRTAGRVAGCQPFKLCIAHARRVRTRNHHYLAEVSHQLLANVRFASGAPAERLIPKDHGILLRYAALRNKKPLTLTDGASAFNLAGSKIRNCSPYIANTVTGHRGGKPVTFIAAKQELVLEIAVSNHQDQMARSPLNIKDLWNEAFETAKIEELAAPVPANVNTHFHGLPWPRLLKFHPGTDPREVPTQILCARHRLLCFFVEG